MKIKDKVLIVEDEQSISSFISMILTANGYDTIIVNTGEEALTMISSHCPDLIVLDLGLPDMDGLEVLRSVRKWSSLPIVVVSARNHERDKVEALDYGADDYLVKPFGTSELLARIQVQLRKGASPLSPVLRAGDVELDTPSRQVTVSGAAVHLTKTEYAILKLLLQNPGQAVAKSVILERISLDTPDCTEYSLKQHVSNLRKKLREALSGDPIQTKVGQGYRLMEDSEP